MMKTGITALIALFLFGSCTNKSYDPQSMRPNILFIITDDQSWEHLGCYGDEAVRTPNVDRLAASGIRYENAYTACPSCSPSRAGILTGQDVYRLEEGGVLTGILWDKFALFPEILAENGYMVGATGKRYWPRTRNVEGAVEEPIGGVYDKVKHPEVPFGISKNDYSANFKQFLEENSDEKPFFFWVGTGEPHRKYEIDRGVKTGIDTSKIRLPDFFPDIPVAKLDVADYMAEIEWADKVVGEMIDILESENLLKETLVIYTSDNGMPHPRAKATLYDHGVRMPLIMHWPEMVETNRVVNDPISLIDMAPTFLDLAGIDIPDQMTGQSIKDIILSKRSGTVKASKEFVVSALEKHCDCRIDHLGYPRRAIHTEEWTFIINYEPDRFPMGGPDIFIPTWDILGDTDPGRLKEYYKANMDKPEFRHFYDLAFGKIPGEQLFNKIDDPDMVNNLASSPEFQDIKDNLRVMLEKYLVDTDDPRQLGESPWDNYRYDKPEGVLKPKSLLW